MYLYVIYSEDNRKVSHPPEVCYLGSGVTIVEKSDINLLGLIPATEFVVEKNDIRQLVVYWFKAGKLYTNQYLKQQAKIAVGRIFGKRISGALVRISVDMKDDNIEESRALISAFAAKIKPLLDKYVP